MAFPFALAIPAAISAISGLLGKKGQDKKAQEQQSAVQKQCDAENQKRIGLAKAVGKAYGVDYTANPELAALLQPRPCVNPNPAAGSTYSLLSDVLGGGALVAGSAMAPKCPPGQILDPATQQCVNPAAPTTENAASVNSGIPPYSPTNFGS